MDGQTRDRSRRGSESGREAEKGKDVVSFPCIFAHSAQGRRNRPKRHQRIATGLMIAYNPPVMREAPSTNMNS